ncbi:hypothetical protein THTE_0092 [Thermogutta terrifontis]|uniref:Uncharacterized protein n=1 Tax=Thermogutta terrifontis TaxID=1331910 RepID=A0A286R9Q0_9BACT|nr:hypothetical protein THTE_0092 [Thermogutta terrifontis]
MGYRSVLIGPDERVLSKGPSRLAFTPLKTSPRFKRLSQGGAKVGTGQLARGLDVRICGEQSKRVLRQMSG